MPLTRDVFGGRAIELAGIIVDPHDQKHGLGLYLVRHFVEQYQHEKLLTYTRNPGILRIVGEVSGTSDVLEHSNPELIADLLPQTAIDNGIIYHLDRYTPTGLYEGFDPADRLYNGQILKQRARLLQNPNHALAVVVNLKGESS